KRTGVKLSDRPRGIGTSMQMGSPRSKRTGKFGRVSFQFIVNVEGSQSVSTMPSSAWAPSLIQLVGPFTQRLMPGGVRNRKGMENVTVPTPKWLRTRSSRASAIAETWKLSTVIDHGLVGGGVPGASKSTRTL